MALKPLVRGDCSIAKALVNGEKVRLLMIGDSITNGVALSCYRMWNLPKITGEYSNLAPNSNTGTGWTSTQPATPAGYGYPFTAMNLAVFDGNALVADSDPTKNTTHRASFDTDRNNVLVNCYSGDWITRAVNASLPFTVELWHYLTAAGIQTQDLYWQLRKQSSPYTQQGALSPKVASYAASPAFVKRSFTASDLGQAGATFYVDSRLTGGITPTAATEIQWARPVHITTGEADGFEAWNIGVGGTDSSDYVNTANVALDFWNTIVPGFGITHLWIAFGTNNKDTQQQQHDNCATLIDRFRAGVPNGPVILNSNYASGAFSAYGGLIDPEPKWVLAYDQLAQDYSGVLHLNSCRAAGPYTRNNVSDRSVGGYRAEWQNCPAGTSFYKHQEVIDTAAANVVYVCKANHTKGGTAPNADATNWLSTGLAYAVKTPAATNENIMLVDGTHPTQRGYDLYAAIIWGLIERAAASGGGGGIIGG